MTWFNYGYSVPQPDGSIIPAGHDFGPALGSYKVGDSLGVRGDSPRLGNRVILFLLIAAFCRRDKSLSYWREAR
jgi:hypothetical protein